MQQTSSHIFLSNLYITTPLYTDIDIHIQTYTHLHKLLYFPRAAPDPTYSSLPPCPPTADPSPPVSSLSIYPTCLYLHPVALPLSASPSLPRHCLARYVAAAAAHRGTGSVIWYPTRCPNLLHLVQLHTLRHVPRMLTAFLHGSVVAGWCLTGV